MPPGDLTQYKLTPAAKRDLENIWVYSAEMWSVDQAESYTHVLQEAFGRLLASPLIARERTEFTPPVRIHPTGPHLIVHRIDGTTLAILRVLGGQQDWQSILHALDQ